MGSRIEHRQIHCRESSPAGSEYCLVLDCHVLRSRCWSQELVSAAQFFRSNEGQRRPRPHVREGIVCTDADDSDNTAGSIACLSDSQRCEQTRVAENCSTFLDNCNNRLRPGWIYYIPAYPAECDAGDLCQLRQFQAAGHGHLPPLRQRMGRAGTDTAGMESTR